MKTSILSLTAAIAFTLICLLVGLLCISYSKIRYYSSKQAGYFDHYIGHKADID